MAAVHGVTTKEILVGPISVSEAPSAITALIGIAPTGPINSLILVNNPTDAAQFGSQVPGFNIPSALDTHFAEGGQAVLVGNVFDPATDTTAVAAEAVTLVNSKGKTAFAPVTVTSVTHTSGTPIYVRDTDYSIDAYGNIQSLNNTTIAAGASIKVNYAKLNAAAITSGKLIGTVAGSGARTGFKMLENAYNLYGKEPKIIIAPGYSELAAIDTEMVYWATRFMAKAIVDAPAGTTVAVALASRGPAGAINFNFANERADLAFPRIMGYDPATDANIAKPYSQFLSGIIGRTDTENNFGYSYSNKAIRTGLGTDVVVTGSFVNSGSDMQALNDQGIVTVIQEGASGLKTSGNRSSAYPASSAITAFHSARRTVDIALRNIQHACKQFIDLPMTSALKAQILETANAYIRTLVRDGIMRDGKALFDDAMNPDVQQAAGKWVITLDWVPSPPLEQIELQSHVNIQLLSNAA